MKTPTPGEAIDGLQQAIDELWTLEKCMEADGIATPETTAAVLEMNALLKREQDRWQEKYDDGIVR